MLDKNEYKGLSDWKVESVLELDGGAKAHSGPWKDPDGDPRHFVVVEEKDRLLPFWGTPRAKELAEPSQWPSLYSRRAEVQENSFKRMIEHGALNVNFGIKKVESEDRHQERRRSELKKRSKAVAEKIDGKSEAVGLQAEKVRESREKEHGKRLSQRERKLEKTEDELKELNKRAESAEEKIRAVGPPKQRADRDFRKQKIMTFRTLLLENLLVRFLLELTGLMDIPISQKCLLELFFKRSGGCVEIFSETIYWVNTGGLSKKNKLKLEKVAEGLRRMKLQRNGKPIRVELRTSSP